MLKKVLKYDLRYVFKFWWIGAVVSIALSVLGGIGIKIEEMSYVKTLPFAVELFAGLIIILALIGLGAFNTFSEILVIIRTYKNFYTDEGYLTFTLPAKRSTLLISKLLTGYIVSAVSITATAINIFIMMCIPFYKDIFSIETIRAIKDLFSELVKNIGIGYILLFIFEIIVAFTLILICSMLLIFLCMSIGSLIAKKAKILASFAIYYGFTNVITSAIFIFMTVIADSLYNWFWDMSDVRACQSFALIGGLAIAFLLMIASLFYLLHYRLLDKKLNLQ